jgi:hypothetical protein
MKNGLRLIAGWVASMIRTARVRRSLVAVLAAVLLLRSHVVRELVAAEFLFALAFVVVLAAAGAAYLIGSVGLSWLEQPRRNLQKSHALLNEGRMES